MQAWLLVALVASAHIIHSSSATAVAQRRWLQDGGLASLTIQGDSPVGGSKWSSNFTTGELHYNISMPKWTKEVTVTPASSSTPPGKISVQTMPVVSGQPSQQIDVSEDYFQLIIIDCGDANITYFLRVIVDFHTPPAPPPPPPQSCAATEEQLCGSSKAASMSACRRCLAEENATLTKVNCTAATYTAFCQGAPPSEPRTCPKLDSPALHAALPTTVVPSDATFLWANATCDDGYHINDGSIHFYCENFPPRQMCMVDAAGNAQWESFQCPCMQK